MREKKVSTDSMERWLQEDAVDGPWHYIAAAISDSEGWQRKCLDTSENAIDDVSGWNLRGRL